MKTKDDATPRLVASHRSIEPEVVDMTGLRIMLGGRPRQWVYDRMRDDSAFPRPIKIGTFKNAWLIREVRAYLEALPRHELTGLSGPDYRASVAKAKASAA
ncbi:hypothetical protein QCE73_08960 [Caballeronia sp. LZ029]|uniref:helix-turn-helix transcriptional regulator n=1 Tax=Caballeronia sp. LZ029 TaxID=3038564 RepID=UPI00285DE8D2|nr:hypothetical protein [Caballeronia sp. LZ029]MDR5743283.1 hypothetical protein [Caballeronia sp. LZ029]